MKVKSSFIYNSIIVKLFFNILRYFSVQLLLNLLRFLLPLNLYNDNSYFVTSYQEALDFFLSFCFSYSCYWFSKLAFTGTSSFTFDRKPTCCFATSFALIIIIIHLCICLLQSKEQVVSLFNVEKKNIWPAIQTQYTHEFTFDINFELPLN